MENPKAESAATGDPDVGDDYARIGVDDYRPPKEEPESELGCGDRNSYDESGRPLPDAEEEPESKVIDVYHHPLKEEPEDAVDVNSYCDYGPAKEEPEPEVASTSDDTDADSGRDVGYDCSHCGIRLCTQKFKVRHELRCKVRTEQKELESQVTKLYHCCYCRCPFLNREYKERHQQRYCRKRPVATRKDSNGTYLKCDECEYVAKYKCHLEKHLLKHNKINAEWFTCTKCSYKTVHKCRLTAHMKIHSNTFSCCCPICGKSFRRKMSLDDHLLRQHSDEADEISKLITSKTYTCDICDRYRTTQKADLDIHVTITHLKGVGCQKYECSRCPYSTFSKGSLTKHSKMHAGQKDYQCAVCKKQFPQKRDLDSHVLYIHPDNVDLVKMITSKIYRCQLCSFKTVKTAKLKSHLQSKHI